MANYSFDDVALLAQIRADILNHPSAYSAGEIFLKEQYGPQRLHKDALADWERDKDHPTQQASHRDSARYLTRAIADATERETRYRETVEQLSDAPRLDQWTHAACASQAIQGLRDAMADGHQDAKTLAVLLLAVMLWDADADTRHAIFTLFGPWGVTQGNCMFTPSVTPATVFLDDEANFRRWMDTVRMAWTAMRQTGAGDALSASAHAPTSTQPGTTYTVAAVLELTGVSDTTLNNYAKHACVKTPGRGKRNHRYTADEVRVILQAIIDNTGERAMKERCRDALAKL